MSAIRTNATMPPRRLCAIRDNWISKPKSFSLVVGNIDSQKSNVVGGGFMDRQFDFLSEISDELIQPFPSDLLDTCSYNETPVAEVFVKHEDSLQSPDAKSSRASRTSCISSCTTVKRKQGPTDDSADFVQSRSNIQCNQALHNIFEAAVSDHPCKKLKQDLSWDAFQYGASP